MDFRINEVINAYKKTTPNALELMNSDLDYAGSTSTGFRVRYPTVNALFMKRDSDVNPYTQWINKINSSNGVDILSSVEDEDFLYVLFYEGFNIDPNDPDEILKTNIYNTSGLENPTEITSTIRYTQRVVPILVKYNKVTGNVDSLTKIVIESEPFGGTVGLVIDSGYLYLGINFSIAARVYNGVPVGDPTDIVGRVTANRGSALVKYLKTDLSVVRITKLDSQQFCDMNKLILDGTSAYLIGDFKGLGEIYNSVAIGDPSTLKIGLTTTLFNGSFIIKYSLSDLNVEYVTKTNCQTTFMGYISIDDTFLYVSGTWEDSEIELYNGKPDENPSIFLTEMTPLDSGPNVYLVKYSKSDLSVTNVTKLTIQSPTGSTGENVFVENMTVDDTSVYLLGTYIENDLSVYDGTTGTGGTGPVDSIGELTPVGGHDTFIVKYLKTDLSVEYYTKIFGIIYSNLMFASDTESIYLSRTQISPAVFYNGIETGSDNIPGVTIEFTSPPPPEDLYLYAPIVKYSKSNLSVEWITLTDSVSVMADLKLDDTGLYTIGAYFQAPPIYNAPPTGTSSITIGTPEGTSLISVGSLKDIPSEEGDRAGMFLINYDKSNGEVNWFTCGEGYPSILVDKLIVDNTDTYTIGNYANGPNQQATFFESVTSDTPNIVRSQLTSETPTIESMFIVKYPKITV